MEQAAGLNLNLVHMVPEIIVLVTALVITLLDSMKLRPSALRRSWYSSLAVLACGSAALSARYLLWNVEELSFGGLFLVDQLAVLLKMIVLLGAGLAILLSERWLDHHEQTSGGYISLMLLSVLGMMFLVSSADLVMLFMGLELMSIPIYVLAAADRNLKSSVEAGLKYLVLGSFSTGIFLFGASLMYGFSGSTTIVGIQNAYAGAAEIPAYAAIGALMMLVGMGFKVSAVPFHMWTPDVYEGAPTPVTAFMGAAVKAASFGVVLKIFAGPIIEVLSLSTILGILAALTMVVGNVAALAQKSVKRMLAYSSVAHAGYLLLGVMASSTSGSAGVLFYALAYTLMTIASFGIFVLLAPKGSESLTYDKLRGMGRNRPWAAIVMTIAMLSLIGLPPTMGFIGKFFLFKAAIEAGFVALAVLGILSSAVSLGYYLRVILVMWFEDSDNEVPVADPALFVGLSFSAAVLLIAGVLPGSLLQLAMDAASNYPG